MAVSFVYVACPLDGRGRERVECNMITAEMVWDIDADAMDMERFVAYFMRFIVGLLRALVQKRMTYHAYYVSSRCSYTDFLLEAVNSNWPHGNSSTHGC